ncbi:hypothetical protein PENCOP_c005G01558 [Penicillium coprophilum]|uniref:Uncharacterized protein n=1 Tax=Penicillium coprophilum TaxID=36646 RepID=A0A1V6US71_9EURO|nr:hypothetical protein PENCOP_c005G01558 [Penicillium coprophilum]
MGAHGVHEQWASPWGPFSAYC